MFSESGSVAGDQALPSKPQASSGKKMSETVFNKVIKDLFAQHESKNGGIEVGLQFDNFMRDCMSVIGENSQMSRDSIRAYFEFYDKNKDGKVTFEEQYPSMLASMKRKGLILTSQAKMLDLSVATMEGDAFSESGSVTGD